MFENYRVRQDHDEVFGIEISLLRSRGFFDVRNKIRKANKAWRQGNYVSRDGEGNSSAPMVFKFPVQSLLFPVF